MNEREVRMRVIEALSTMGVRSSQELVRHAEPTVAYIMAGEDNAPVVKPAKAPRNKAKTDDKVAKPVSSTDDIEAMLNEENAA
jgi:hypothetical protein